MEYTHDKNLQVLFKEWNIPLDLEQLQIGERFVFSIMDLEIGVVYISNMVWFYHVLLEKATKSPAALMLGAELNACFKFFKHGVTGLSSNDSLCIGFNAGAPGDTRLFVNNVNEFLDDVAFAVECMAQIKSS